MRKYTLFSFVLLLSLVFAFNFNTVPVNAAVVPAKGLTANQIKAFQKKLVSAGCTVIVDGKLGAKTKAAATNCNIPLPTASTPPVINSTSSISISGVSGPQSLDVNTQGLWTVTASDSTGGNLSYSVVWGDEAPSGARTSLSSPIQQTASFSHSYAQTGLYNPTFIVNNANGQTAQTSLTVNVGGVSTTNQPSIHLYVTSGDPVSQSSDSGMSVNVGNKFVISGMPQNLQGLSYWSVAGSYPPSGYYNMAYFFDQNFGNDNSCGNNDSAVNTTWTMTCTATVPGSSYFYVVIYANGQTYQSNSVKVSVVSETTTLKPYVSYKINGVQGGRDTVVPVKYGDPVNISWSSNGDYCEGYTYDSSSTWNGRKAASGSMVLTDLGIGKHVMVINCYSPKYGKTNDAPYYAKEDTLTVDVETTSPTLKPYVSYKINGVQGGRDYIVPVKYGDPVNISWTSNADYCEGYTYDSTSAWNGTKAASGSTVITDLGIGKHVMVINCYSSKYGKSNDAPYYAKEDTLTVDVETTSPTTSSITVLSPNGGEVFTAGQQIPVRWQSYNVPKIESLLVEIVRADVINNPIGRWILLSGSTPNTGFQTLTLDPNLAPGTYELAVKRYIYDGDDISDNLFTIVSGPTTGTLCPNGNTLASGCITPPLCPNGMTLASNCMTPPKPSVTPSCVYPKVYDPSSNTCINTPPIVPTCVAPKVYDPSSNTCINLPPVVPTCNLPQVYNSAANACITPIPPPSNGVTITTTSLPNAKVGDSYMFNVEATGGADAYGWGMGVGSFPPGLGFGLTNCTSTPCKAPAPITGTPTTAGTYTFSLNLYSGPLSTSKQFTLTVLPAGAVQGASAFNFTQRLIKGAKGNEVMELQKYLNLAGYDVGNADGKFGKKTEDALKKFQKDNNLAEDGRVGPGVRAWLNKGAKGGNGFLSPKGGDQLVVGQTYPISLSQGFASDYHPLLQTFAVLDNAGNQVGAICPEVTMKKGDASFSWVAGALISSCGGTSNVSVNAPLGKYQILFTELDSNGKTLRTVKSGWFNLVDKTSSSTYTYKNHGFTMELPTGYVPHEEQSEGGPSISITLPNNINLSYWTDASWWAKYSLPEYIFKDEVKIGATIFKVYYTDSKQLIYWFQQGNVGYEFSGQPQRGDPTTLLQTFNYVGFN